MTPLAFIASASFRSERTVCRRFHRGEVELARLLRDGLVDIHSLSPRAYHVTAKGRAALAQMRVERSMARAG